MNGRVSQGSSNESREGGRDCGMGEGVKEGSVGNVGASRSGYWSKSKGCERNVQKATTELCRQRLITKFD